MRLPTIARNLSLAACTAAEDFREEPLQLLIQVSRRLPERARTRIGATVGVGHPGPVRAAYAAWIVDRPDDARAQLRAARPLSRTGQRLFAELAKQLDEPGLIPPSVMRGRLADRVARRRGDVVEPWTPPRASLPRSPSVRSSNEPISVFHLLTNSLPYTSSGYAHRSHAVLKAQRAAGLRVAAATRLGYPVIVGKLGASRHDVIDGIDYHRLLPWRRRTGLAAQVQQTADLLEPLVRSFGADVLSTTTDYTNGLVAAEVASRLGIPWTYEIRGLPEETWVASKPAGRARDVAEQSLRYRTFRSREAEVSSAAAHVFALGETLAEDMMSRGVPADRLTVVPNFTDADLPSPEPASARSRLGLAQDGFWVGTTTSMVEYEGLGTIIDAVALARRGGADVRALLVGDGAARPGIAARIAERGLEEFVKLPGRVPKHDVAQYLAAIDTFVVPRIHATVCEKVPPLKPVEAMAAGRAVLVAPRRALAELGTDGVITVPDDDATSWARVITDLAASGHAAELGRRALAAAQRRSSGVVGARYADVLEQLTRTGATWR